MATWNDLVSHVRSQYQVAKEEDGFLGFVFNLGDDRSQMVILTRQLLMDGQEEWVQIQSPVAEVGKVNLEAVLREAGTIVVGGLAIDGDFLVLQGAIPLENMQINEFERPFLLITIAADGLEKKFTGADNM